MTNTYDYISPHSMVFARARNCFTRKRNQHIMEAAKNCLPNSWPKYSGCAPGACALYIYIYVYASRNQNVQRVSAGGMRPPEYKASWAVSCATCLNINMCMHLERPVFSSSTEPSSPWSYRMAASMKLCRKRPRFNTLGVHKTCFTQVHNMGQTKLRV